MLKLLPGEHIPCLDLFKISSLPGSSGQFVECAILLEIWEFGGLLQTSLPIQPETVLSIPSIATGIVAKVVSCQQDEFGYLVEISVADSAWFPNGYYPPQILARHAGA